MRNGFILLVFSIVLCSSAQGAVGYKQYFCNSKDEARSCAESCINTDKINRRISFIVNSYTSVVMKNTFNDSESGKLESSEMLQQCMVADSKNWICSTRPSREEITDKENQDYSWMFDETQSVEGQITQLIETHPSKKHLEEGKTPKVSNSCFRAIPGHSSKK